MLPNLKNYIIGVLLVLTCMFGYTSYRVYGNNMTLQVEVSSYILKLEQSQEDIVKAGESCKQAQIITQDVNQSINVLQDDMTKSLQGLAEMPATTLQDALYEDSDGPTEAGKKYADSARLSPSLMQLLHRTYCETNKHDSACTAK